MLPTLTATLAFRGIAFPIAWAAIDTAIAVGAVSVIGALVVAAVLYSRRLGRIQDEVKLAAIRAYGLADRDPKGFPPMLEAGTLVWTHLKAVREPQTLLAAVDSALSVARQLRGAGG